METMELHHLDLRYAGLRVLDPGRVSRLAASIARDGQRAPVLVAGCGVLVDGYHRVQALEELGRDTVATLALQVGEAEALVLAWRLETGRRKSALEEGWLVAELAQGHGRTVTELSMELRRPKSWVSQRLGLARVLPELVQEAVRAARVPAQAAMKSLVPMARQDASACERLVANFGEPVTVRQVARIVAAWRVADAEGRARIVAQPMLLLKAEEAVSPVEPDAEERLARDLEGVAGLCRRARRAVQEGVFARANRSLARRSWEQASEAFRSLEEEVRRARP
jgi:ParB-like chromosome segregation protein Spo0J